MVVLGIGQIQAQQPTPGALDAPPPSIEYFVTVRYNNQDLGHPTNIVRWERQVLPDGTILGTVHFGWPDASPKPAHKASLQVVARCRVTGNTSVWQCIPPFTPPWGMEIVPPTGLGPCDSWTITINSVFTDVPCSPTPLNFPISFRYYMTPSVGGYVEVGHWNLANPRSDCDGRYHSTTSLTVELPSCRRNGVTSH
jgi:hypothetical protein